MQTFIYTDASKKDEKNGIAIEFKTREVISSENKKIKNTVKIKSYFFRFENIKFKNKDYSVNELEELGLLLAVALSTQYKHEKIFIFNDNITAIKNLNKFVCSKPEIDEIFSQFSNIQFGWLQNDMEEMKMVDYLSRIDFKHNQKFDLDKIKYKEIIFKEEIQFNSESFEKYLKHNCLLLKRLMGFEPNVEDLNKMLIEEMSSETNKRKKKDLIENYDTNFKLKEKIISIKNNVNKEIIYNKNEKVRIYEIAKELEISSKEVLDFAKELKIEVKSAQTLISLYEAEKIINKVFEIEKNKKQQLVLDVNNKTLKNSIEKKFNENINTFASKCKSLINKEIILSKTQIDDEKNNLNINNNITSPSFIEEQPIITKSGIKIKQKKNSEKTIIKQKSIQKIKKYKHSFSKNQIIIEKDEKTGKYKKNLFQIKGKNVPYIFEELIEQDLIKEFIDSEKCTDKESYLIQLLVMNKKIDLKIAINFIEKSNNKKYILMFLKIFNIEKFNLILNNSKELLRKDYRRGVPSICKYYNKYGFLFRD